ncbi:hypothetical protein BJ875DRAFT_436421 [Amylocarpus encephaloides]|uniref:BTB domain-containing protein n=1 Tax=Amylocarpus encephaloides TaxID=45428 RepID=A0A9P7YU30_9HELO|nr:hypothetical protein BJ875DRAFT_436421 [Amylocarpus encephaloides]
MIDLDVPIVHGPKDVANGPQIEKEIRMLVSSKHLSLASKVFKSMFQLGFTESKHLRKNGKLEMTLPDDDPVAFALLMCIVHAKNKLIPPEIDLPTLERLEISVDKYGFQESAQYWAESYIEKLGQGLPDGLCRELFAWLCISWVFRHADKFAVMTRTAIYYCPTLKMAEQLDGEKFLENLPIPKNVIEAIENARRSGIQTAFDRLYHFISSLRATSNAVDFCPRALSHCIATLLGSLERSALKQEV